MQFSAKVYRQADGVTTVVLDAPDREEATRHLTAQGYQILGLQSQGGLLLATPRLKFPLQLFNQELYALLDAGLPLVEAIDTLAAKEKQPGVRRLLETLLAALREGQPFSKALGRFPDIFPTLYRALLRAAETTGHTKEAIKRHIEYQAQIDVVKRKVISASLYPAVLCIAAAVVLLFLLFYVIPRFSQVYEDLGSKLPLASRLLMMWGKLLEQHGAAVLPVALAVLGGLAFWLSRKSTRIWVVNTLLKFPALGERARIYRLARFYRTVGILLAGGIPLTRALELSALVLPESLQPSLAAARRDIAEGLPVAATFAKHGLATEVSNRLTRAGELSGSLGDMLLRVADFYDEDMGRWVDWFARLIEPILMAFIGGLIGGVVLLMYLPIFELAGSIQ